MIYLDNGATSFYKPLSVKQAVMNAMHQCASPGRGGYKAARNAGDIVYHCRELAGALFDCAPDQVVFTSNCTHGLNIAIRTLVKPGDRVVISGFEHNAVVRPLYAINAKICIAGREAFDQEDTLKKFEIAVRNGADMAIFTHCSNVFGYILPIEEMAKICRKYKIPFIIDCAQSAGVLPVSLRELGADFIAMPGHKGLLGPQGTGLLLCGRTPDPLLFGGTGSQSALYEMPEYLPDRGEAGTLNVPGIAGLAAGLSYIQKKGTDRILSAERQAARDLGEFLRQKGFQVFLGEAQTGTVSFVPNIDCESAAGVFDQWGIAVRAGLHCAPLAHESAGTLSTGTVRISFGIDSSVKQVFTVKKILEKVVKEL